MDEGGVGVGWGGVAEERGGRGGGPKESKEKFISQVYNIHFIHPLAIVSNRAERKLYS